MAAAVNFHWELLWAALLEELQFCWPSSLCIATSLQSSRIPSKGRKSIVKTTSHPHNLTWFTSWFLCNRHQLVLITNLRRDQHPWPSDFHLIFVYFYTICRWWMGDSEWSPEIFIPRTFKGDRELGWITWNRGRRVRESFPRNSRGRQISGHQARFQCEFARHARVPKRSRVAQSITPSPPCSSRRLLRRPRIAGKNSTS